MGNIKSYKFLTIKEAKSLICNGCGDCCDSRNATGPFGWGRLPKTQYKSLNNGNPLIIPLNEEKKERSWQPGDFSENSFVLFKCSAQLKDGKCSLHNKERPKTCGMFPINYPDEKKWTLPYRLKTSYFPKCTWHNIIILKDNDILLMARNKNNEITKDSLSEEEYERYLIMLEELRRS